MGECMENGRPESCEHTAADQNACRAADTERASDARERMGLASSIKPGADSDAASRAARRSMRERLNNKASRQALIGVIATLLGGSFWGFSGTSASFLFANYQIDTMWLMAVRQLGAGAVFMVVVLLSLIHI